MPFRITLESEGLFAMAGIWDKWITPKGEDIYSFSVLTLPANDRLAFIHDRMPVILPKEMEREWLKEMTSIDRKKLLRSITENPMKYYPVSGRVGNVQNNDPSLIVPVQRGTQGSLF